MPTNPHNAPVQTPTKVGFPCKKTSNSNHVSIETAVATVVVKNAARATLFIPKADPALNPYHPIHKIAVPNKTQDKL
jgi:hypothetical protein